MAMKRIKDQRTGPQLFNNTETININTDNPKINDISKIATSSFPRVEILRTNSPTFKRLTAVRIKLDKYISSIPNTIPVSQTPVNETLSPEKQSTTNVRIPSSSQKKIKSKKKFGTGPLDKITYEKTWTHNGSVKQKCSLEIWLPKAGSDDEDGNTGRTASPDTSTIDKESQSLSIKSRRESTTKLSETTKSISETKSLDETSSKKSQSTTIPRVYYYQENIVDQPEEQPRSSQSAVTSKSDGNGPNKNLKRQRTRPHIHRQSSSTNNTDDTVQSAPSVLPMTSKNLLANIKQTYSDHETKGTSASSNSSTLNELMRKYSMIKKSHQELTQPKLQLEKPHHDSKYDVHITKDHSLPSPPASDSIPYNSFDHPIISGKRLLGDTSPPQSSGDSINTNTKLNDRRSSHRKPTNTDVYAQTRLFSLANHLQHRQTSASIPTDMLPAVIGKKNEDPNRFLSRNKTLDVIFAVPIDNSSKIPSRLPARPASPPYVPNSFNILQRPTNENEQIPSRLPKRTLPPPSNTLRSEQQQQQISQPLVQLVQYQNIQNSAQRYHRSAHSSSSSTATTEVPTNKVLVHLKYSNGGNTDRNCLIPE